MLMCNDYCKCSIGVEDIDLDYLRAIAEATGGCRRCVLAFGDWNITPAELEASGILDGLGLEIVARRTVRSLALPARGRTLIM